MTWDKWVNDDGVIAHLTETCPRAIDKLVEDATEKALHKQIAVASGKPELEQGLFLDPIAKLLSAHGQ